MHYRLRYLHHDLALTDGQFAVGRNASCQLSLDDPLVSRRHALLTVGDGGITIEDLQSRNGVIVNGQRITARVALNGGDRIVIGAQELTLLEGRDTVRETQTAAIGNRTLPRIQAGDGSHPPADDNTVVSVPAPVGPSRGEPDAESSVARRADAFSLLGKVAEKALALGRTEEAERLLTAALADVMEGSRAGKHLPPALVDTAARFASKLASSTTKGAWVDYTIELYVAQNRVCPGPVIDELYAALRKVSAFDIVRLRAYVARLRERLATFGPTERFLFQRLEGLERLAGLR